PSLVLITVRISQTRGLSFGFGSGQNNSQSLKASAPGAPFGGGAAGCVASADAARPSASASTASITPTQAAARGRQRPGAGFLSRIFAQSLIASPRSGLTKAAAGRKRKAARRDRQKESAGWGIAGAGLVAGRSRRYWASASVAGIVPFWVRITCCPSAGAVVCAIGAGVLCPCAVVPVWPAHSANAGVAR